MTKTKRIDPIYGIPRKTHPDEPIKKCDNEEREFWRLMEIIPHDHHYTAYERLDVLMAYVATGKPMKVASLTNVPYSTIIAWKNKSKWWKPALREIRKQKDDELDARLSAIIEKSLNEMDDRLENGDEIIDKDGNTIRRKVSFKDLSVAGVAVSFDKRALGRGEPTARIEQVSDAERTKRLQQQFKAIAQEKVVEGELLEKKDNEPDH